MRCVTFCLYKTVEMVTEFGYIFVAINGTNLCGACRASFALLTRQAAQVRMHLTRHSCVR